MGFSPKILQDFTYALCYTYVRVCLPVSYVPPVYYADRLCERARAYVRGVSVKAEGMTRPVRPSKEDDDTDDTWDAKIKQHNRDYKVWEKLVVEAWEKLDDGGKDMNEQVVANAEGPWHPQLNNTMFWM